jgi:transposase InsO family protein
MVYKPQPPADVRIAAIEFPDDAPRGAVSAFCVAHGVSRSWFYKIRGRARAEGTQAALRPKTPDRSAQPGRVPDQIEDLALMVRDDLKSQGKDYGPISVASVLRRRYNLVPPSRATLARLFLARGKVKPEPSKRPRSSFQRFDYSEPNACWQLDGFEYRLAGGRKTVILQVEDDYSRMILATVVASSETSKAVIDAIDKAIAAHGVPQRFLSDNGAAFNRARWGRTTRTEAHLRALGVTPMTGRPGHPRTQGKNERLHQTVIKFLDANQPITSTTRLIRILAEFETWYNTERPNQALPPDTTPAERYNGAPKATTPTPPRNTPHPPPDLPATAQTTHRTSGA